MPAATTKPIVPGFSVRAVYMPNKHDMEFEYSTMATFLVLDFNATPTPAPKATLADADASAGPQPMYDVAEARDVLRVLVGKAEVPDKDGKTDNKGRIIRHESFWSLAPVVALRLGAETRFKLHGKDLRLAPFTVYDLLSITAELYRGKKSDGCSLSVGEFNMPSGCKPNQMPAYLRARVFFPYETQLVPHVLQAEQNAIVAAEAAEDVAAADTAAAAAAGEDAPAEAHSWPGPKAGYDAIFGARSAPAAAVPTNVVVVPAEAGVVAAAADPANAPVAVTAASAAEPLVRTRKWEPMRFEIHSFGDAMPSMLPDELSTLEGKTNAGIVAHLTCRWARPNPRRRTSPRAIRPCAAPISLRSHRRPDWTRPFRASASCAASSPSTRKRWPMRRRTFCRCSMLSCAATARRGRPFPSRSSPTGTRRRRRRRTRCPRRRRARSGPTATSASSTCARRSGMCARTCSRTVSR
jgi:hypothetical protein